MLKNILRSAVLLTVFNLSACTLQEENTSPLPSISVEEKRTLSSSINCNTAQRDLKILEEEKASVGRRMVAGVRSMLPISAVVGILTNDYNDRVEVATGQYNEDLGRKISEIKLQCGLI